MIKPYKSIFVEKNINYVKNLVMPIIKRTSSQRRSIIGQPINNVYFVDIQGNIKNPILNFYVIPTKSTKVQIFVKGKTPKKGKLYKVQIQLLNFKDYIEIDNLLSQKQFSSILKKINIKVDCTCYFFHWGGIRYGLSLQDLAIYTTTIPNNEWMNKTGYSEPSICKHIKDVLAIIDKKSNQILINIKKKFL